MAQTNLNEYESAYPWRNEDVVRELYVEEDLTDHEIADRLDCTSSNITKWRKKHEIDTAERDQSGTDAPWGDEDRLREMYFGQLMTPEEISNEFGCHTQTIYRAFDRQGIETMTRAERASHHPASLFVTDQGYMRWTVEHEGEQDRVYVHQLLAIAMGADPYDVFSNGEWQIHHKNGIKWDNCPDNVEFISRGEHVDAHGNLRVYNESRG